MDTKYQDYFNSRISQPSLTDIAVGDSKYRDLQEASNRKILELEQLRLQQEEEEKAAKAAHDASLVGKLDLAPEDPLGLGINTVVGVGKTAVDVGAWVAGAPATAWKATQPAISTIADLIPDPISNAYRKLDDALSIRLTSKTAQDLTQIVRDPIGLLDSTGKAAQKAVTPLYNTTVERRLMGEMGQAYDENDGVLNVAAEMVKTAVSNPVAGAQLFITQLPYMQALAAKGVLGASAYMGMVSDFTQQSITKYKESHEGKEPDSAEMAAMLGTSIASVGIEKLESMFLLNKFKGAVPGNKLLTVPAKYGTGGITEFGQETTQNLLVDAGGFQDKLLTDEALLKKSLREAVIAGGMGMTSGSVGGAGMKVLQPSEAKLQAVKQSAEVTAAVQASINTGDYTPLTDPKSATYAPEAAVSALFHTATLPDATPEVKQANFEQANQILSDLTAKAELLRKISNETPVAKEAMASELTDHENFIAAAKAQLADPATTLDKRNKLEDKIQETEYLIKTMTKRGRYEIGKELKDVEAKLATTQKQLVQFNQENQGKNVDIAAEVAVINTATAAPESQAAMQASATKLMKMAMIIPENIDSATADELSKNANLDEATRTYFRKFSEARVAENAAKDVKGVNQDVLFGSGNKKGIKYIGVNEYRAQFGVAAAANDSKRAIKLLAGITNFMNDHAAKAAMASKIREAAMVVHGDNKQLVNNKGTWELNTGTTLSEKALRENGGLNLHFGSKDLVNGIQTEAKVIRTAVEELQAAFKIQFPKQVLPNVTITPTKQQPVSTGTQSPAKATPVQAPASVRKTGSSNTGRTPDAAGNRKVEASAVTKDKLVSIMDTDAIYSSWSNVRDGSDRAVFTNLIKSTIALLSKVDLIGKESLVTKDLMGQKWFRSATAEQRAAFVKELVSRNSKTTPPTPLQESAPVEVTTSQPNQKGATNGKVQEAAQAEVLSETRDVKVPGKPKLNWDVTSRDDEGNIIEIRSFATEKEATAYRNKQDERGFDNELSKSGDVVTDEAPASSVNTEEVVSTDQIEQPAVGEATTVAEEEATEVQDGTLAAVQGTVDETTAYKDRNLAHYFTQVAGSIKDGSRRPLVAVKNFLTWISKDVSKVVEFVKQLTDSEGLTEEQTRALNLFVSKSTEWQDIIKNNLAMKTGTSVPFKYEDLMQFFMTGTDDSSTWDVEENIKTAISYAVFNQVMSDAGKSPYNTKEDINKLLGRDKDHAIHGDEYKVFNRKALLIDTVQNSLGKSVFKALGLKADKSIPTDVQPRLESALGMHAMKLMLDIGLMEQVTVPYKTWASFKDVKPSDTPSGFVIDEDEDSLATSKPSWVKDEVTMVRMVRKSVGETLEYSDEVAEIMEATKGSQSILDKLFSLEANALHPSLKPIPFKDKTPSRSQQGIPALLRKALELNQKSARKIDDTKMGILSKLGDEIIMHLGGVDVEAEGTKAHLRNRMSNKAKNDALRREWLMLKEFMDTSLTTGFDTPFYYKQEPWIMQRVGIKTQAGNPLSSKIARFVIYSPKWESKVSLDNMTSFKLRVAEGLGVSTDKKSNATVLDSFDEMFNSDSQEPAVKAKADLLNQAIAALIVGFSGELNATQKQAIVDGVQAGGENMHSFDALMGMAQYRNAIQKDEETFTVRMMGEMDGVTSGIMLSTLLYGAGQNVTSMFNRINKGGFFKENEATAYNIWRGTPGHKDQYETFVSALNKVLLANNTTEFASKKLGAIQGFIGSLETSEGIVTSQWRNFIKPAINAIAFGSGTKTVTTRLSEAMVDAIYARIEKAKTNEEAAAIVKDINELLNTTSVVPNMTVAELMEFELNYTQTKIIKGAFVTAFDESIEQALKAEFADYLDRRDVITRTSTVAFTIYDTVKKGIRNAYIAELKADDKLPVNKQGVLLHDLTQEQEDVITERMKGLLPLVHTAMSKKDDDINNGVLLAKASSAISYTVPNTSTVKYRLDGKIKSASTHATRRTEVAAGVSVLSKLLHAFDSAVMHQSAIDFDGHIFSAHDAGGTGLDTVNALGTSLNKNLWFELLNYSPTEEVYQMYATLLENLAGVLDTLPSSVVTELKTALQPLAKEDSGYDVGNLLDGVLREVKQNAFDADTMKFNTMSEMAVVNQYAAEGGAFEPSLDQRTEVKNKAEALTNEIPEKTQNAVNKIIIKLTGKAKVAPVKTVNNNWGGLGTPKRAPNVNLESKFKKQNTVSAKQVLNWVIEDLPKSRLEGQTSKFYTNLANLMLKALPVGLTVTLITSKTDPLNVDKANGAKDYPAGSHGWYDPNSKQIFILGSEFSNSAISNAMLLHELLHGILVSRMGDTNSPLVKNMELILASARKYVKGTALETKYANALSNIHEMLAYGLTYEGFQNDVLKAFNMEEKEKYSLINGMAKFVKTITEFFFGAATKEFHKSAMAALIYNASALLSEEAKSSSKVQGESFKGMSVFPSIGMNDFTTAEIHAALNEGKVTQGFTDHLQGLLDGIVTKLHGPFGSLKGQIAQSVVSNPLDLWIEAQRTGKAPFASEMMGLSFAMSQQEAFVADQVYATVKAALDSHEGSTKVAYKRLSKLYEESKARLTAADFTGGQDEYNAVFKEEANNEDKSDYLARFAALGLASQQLNRLLHVPTSFKIDEVKNKKDVSAWLQNIFETILEFFASKFTHTPAGTLGNVTLTALVTQLVSIEKHRVEDLNSVGLLDNVMPALESATKGITDNMAKRFSAMAKSNYVKNHKNAGIKAAGALVDTIASQRVGFLLDEVRKAYDFQFKGKQGLAGELLGYTVGAAPMYQTLLRTLKHFENIRKHKISDMGAFVTDAFQKPLTKEESAGMTATLMRTGAHYLMDKFSLVEIANLISDPASLEAAQKSYETKIASYGKLQHYYLHQANALAALVALGGGRDEFTMMNAHNIAHLYGTGQEKHTAKIDLIKAEEEIKILVTLYAIGYTKDAHKTNASRIITQEMTRVDENGFEFTLLAHKALEAKSLNQLFSDNPIQMQHGYTPEIYDPHTEVVAANEEQGKDLINQGYKQAERLPVDPADPEKEIKHLYVMQGRGLPRRVSGLISLSGLSVKGKTKHNGFTNPNYGDGLNNAILQSTIEQNKQAAIQRLFKAYPRKDLSKSNRSYVVPVLNDSGETKNWRYMMQENTKDVLLNRTSALDKVLGKFAGSIYDKVSSKEHNKNAIAALHEEYLAGIKTSPNAYITIGPKSSDPELREIWNLLSQETKNEVNSVWGKDELLIRGDAKNIIFGYQKYELSKMFTKEERNVLEDGFVKLTEWMLEEYALYGLHKTPEEAKAYARRAAMNIAKGQRAWQELVQVSKDNIVVKSITVLLGNDFSNVTQLKISGVSFKDIVHHRLVAYRGAIDYSRDNKRLAEYEQMLESGYIKGSRADIEANIIKLKNALARNPVREMIDAGMMPTIVEDISAEEDPYSYKTALMQEVSKHTEKMNPTVLSAAKNLLLAHDTPAYMGLSRMTQLSDFVARYTLYQHLINKKVDPMSKENAMQEASEAFVNYDIPMPKGMQFMDDMGFMIFTKYFFSIQRQLVKLSAQHPIQVLLTVLIDNYINLGPTVLQGSFISHFGNNPFGMGILSLPNSVGEIAPINAALSVLN